ncbi:MFS transporter [Marivivens donghaensis]|uniref:MFS transporter n=1 Tax=Marivivens donghaensis TaxID=1699413 RepID=A0ABX0VW63_9RHOB|nr:MFS transporter [Marivivens donghaensis]NIY72308.1 MFS transporter [Marivivens donghaensis]
MTMTAPMMDESAVRRRMLMVFAVQGIMAAALNMRIPDIQLALGLSESQLGYILACGTVGAVIVFVLSTSLVDRFGTRRLIIGTNLIMLGAIMAAASATSGAVLAASLLVFGAMMSLSNIGINVEADRVEAATTGRLMNRCHGLWSVMFFASTAASAAIRAQHISPFIHFLIFGVIYAVLTVVLTGPMTECPPREVQSGPKRRFVLPTLAVFGLLAYAVGGDLLEGASRTWSTIYMRDEFDISRALEGVAAPTVVLAMALVRLTADRLVERMGAPAMGRLAAITAFVGLLIVTIAPNAYVAILGFALVGMGIAPVYPLTISAAARLGDRPAADNVAAVALVFQGVMLFAPPVIGFVAEGFGIRTAFGLFLPLLLLSILMARRLK